MAPEPVHEGSRNPASVATHSGGTGVRRQTLQCIALAVSTRPLQRRAQLGKTREGGTGPAVSRKPPALLVAATGSLRAEDY